MMTLSEALERRSSCGVIGAARSTAVAAGSFYFIDSGLRDQLDDAALRVRTTFDVALCRCQARMTGQVLNIAQAAAALDAPLGSPCDEKVRRPLWLDAPLKPRWRYSVRNPIASVTFREHEKSRKCSIFGVPICDVVLKILGAQSTTNQMLLVW